MRIDSVSNDRIKAVRRLHRGSERRRTPRTLIEGPKLVEVSLAAGLIPIEVYTFQGGEPAARCASAGSRMFEVSARVLEAISTTVEPQDPVGVIAVPEQQELEVRRTAVAVGVGDPGNVGTLIRSAAALGWQVALIGGADPWNPKVLRSSAGVQLSHPAVVVDGLEALAAIGLDPIATTVSGGVDPSSLQVVRPIAVLIGNESKGLPESMIERCVASLTIPIAEDVESLNVSVAGALVMYALDREDIAK